jgi:HSP20 family molecular chaperone IbpA
MADAESKALQAKEKTEMGRAAEQTRQGLAFTPAVDIYETDKQITLLADLPGVKAKDLVIDLHENILTLSGEVESPEQPDEVKVLREYRVGKYFREFSLSELIDQAKIEAELEDGVLTLKLPKMASATPRKIAVKAS